MTSAQEDDESLSPRYCVPLGSLTAPVEVGEIGYRLSLPGPLIRSTRGSHISQLNPRRLLGLLRLATPGATTLQQ